MDITNVQRLGGTPQGIVGACSELSGAPPVAPVASDRCPRTVPPNTGRGVIHLAREGPTARFLHEGGTYWKQSKRVLTGRGCERFREEALLYLRQVWVVQIPPCMENIELWSTEAA